MKHNELIEMVKDRKTITIDGETYNELAKLGDLSDTFDGVIRRLIDEHKRNVKKK